MLDVSGHQSFRCRPNQNSMHGHLEPPLRSRYMMSSDYPLAETFGRSVGTVAMARGGRFTIDRSCRPDPAIVS
jgi:hypothetical protein